MKLTGQLNAGLFVLRFRAALYKLGLTGQTQVDKTFVDTLLQKMSEQQLDYTQTFTELRLSLDDETLADQLESSLGDWYRAWTNYIGSSEENIKLSKNLMIKNNPVVIPRNHHVEAVLNACEEAGST